MISLPSEKLKEILVEKGVIEPQAFDVLVQEAAHKEQNIIDILISQGIVTKDYFFKVLAEMLGIPLVNLGVSKIDEEALRLLPEEIARQRRVVVFRREKNGTLAIAMEDPTDLETLDFLKLRLGISSIQPYLATDEDLQRGFSFYERQLTQDFKEIIEESIKKSMRSKAKGDLKEAASDLPIVDLTNNIFCYAKEKRYTDIFLATLSAR